MNKIFLSLLSLNLILSANSLNELTTPGEFIDFGTHGKEYRILENDILEEINRETKKFAFDSNEVKDIVQKQVIEAAFESTTKPLCVKDTYKKPEIDYAFIPEDIYNPVGRKIYSKGDKIKAPLKAGQVLDLCFIDSRIIEVGKNQINTFIKQYPNCNFLVANKNVLSLRQVYPELKIFPTNKSQEDRFNVECYPAVVHMENETKETFYHSYDKFKN